MKQESTIAATDRTVALFNPDSERALAFARACPRYSSTPLHSIDLKGVNVLVKDESTRFGLGSFKALGGIYAVAQLLLDAVEAENGARPAMEDMHADSVRAIADTQTYVCASAGNHGLAVATGARLFGAHARIHVSAEVPSDFVKRLQERGAEVCISGATYEESLEAANQDSRESGALLLADGSWEGYTKPPALVMEGYTVLACELRDQFRSSGEWPTDIYLQAGVGGMAAAVTLMIRRDWSVQPRIVIVEPSVAQCLAMSADHGHLVEAVGPVSTMGRLDCKAASLLAFDTLIRSGVEYRKVDDDEAQSAVDELAHFGLLTTPSGAAGFAAFLGDRSMNMMAGDKPLVIMSEQAITS